ncbi:MAG: hypothetical protein COV69_04115 [Parcubacteria group bacterium CG11_big_fil_rev_8_21_14_0_20_39_14]|nr:MAG: hypothetical protein COV69_04115 [Parcubacteria group bacterium CG11_big_fil_rev_8_21_14_0_20_39_14]PIS35133.1 MAG: hypothetical protein COT36_04245 [Parcubacteria group bacterium CG08_land_8_20_14_0_20_38_56]
MSIYDYKAKSFSGEIKSGKLEVKNEKELANTLLQEGYILIYSELSKKKNLFSFDILGRFKRVSLVEKIVFCQHLSLMIKAGLPLTKALEVLVRQTKNKTFKKTILEVKEDITRGKLLSESLKKHSGIFSELFCSMIEVGEEGGKLEEILRFLVRQLEKEHELNSRLKGAMIYPAIIFATMVIIGVLLMVIVMPQFMVIFEEMEISLPFTTSVFIGIAKFLNNFWYLIPIIVFGIIFLKRLITNSKSGKIILDYFFLSAPIIGPFTQKINVAKISRTLGSLIISGVPILRSLKVASHTIGNHYYRDTLNFVSNNLLKGKGLSESFQEYEKVYPALFIQILAIGEETGTLSEVLEHLANFFEEEISNTTKNFSSIIEPILLLVTGLMVAFFAVSIIQAIYTPIMHIK